MIGKYFCYCGIDFVLQLDIIIASKELFISSLLFSLVIKPSWFLHSHGKIAAAQPKRYKPCLQKIGTNTYTVERQNHAYESKTKTPLCLPMDNA